MLELRESNMESFKQLMPFKLNPIDLSKTTFDLPDFDTKYKANKLSPDAISNGRRDLYNYDWPVYSDMDGSQYLVNPNMENKLPKWRATKVTDNIQTLLPKLDYIGGTSEEVREKVARRIPGFLSKISNLSEKYGIDRNLLLHRIKKEGFFDELAKQYNRDTHAANQKSFWESIPNMEINGFYSLGLDDAATELSSGAVKPLRDVSYEVTTHSNEKGRTVQSIIAPYDDALEIKAASLKHRQDVMRSKGTTEEDLNTWTNAAYNLGMNHKDLQDSTWIRKNYTVPNYDHYYK